MSCWQEVRDFEFRGSLHVGLTDIGWAAVIYSSYVFSVGKVIPHAHPRLGALIMMHLHFAVILLRRAYIAWEKNTTIGILIACVFLVCMACVSIPAVQEKS